MNEFYYRPVVQSDALRPAAAVPIAGGGLWFTHAARLSRTQPPTLVPATEIPSAVLNRITIPRPPLCGVDMQRTSILAVLNVTPDSFSDGGRYDALDAALDGARAMVAAGADMIYIGGESTRPGADFVPAPEEIRRTVPVIKALRAAGLEVPISIDTRKAAVAQAAFEAGANLFNDVTALTFDPESLPTAAALKAPLCLMHAAGDPKTMQADPQYDDVVLDVYDYLESRVAVAEAAGIPRHSILVDPGIGFGKTLDHNLELLKNLSIFHAIGCPILLGVSRKRFIGTIGNEPQADKRMPGSVAVALHGMRQGVQMLRVHDIAETKQAVALTAALLN